MEDDGVMLDRIHGQADCYDNEDDLFRHYMYFTFGQGSPEVNRL